MGSRGVQAQPFFAPGGGYSDYVNKLGQIESRQGQMPDRPGSQFHGKYQLGPGVGGQGSDEHRLQAVTQQNYDKFSRGLGRAPSKGELYLAHQQGVQGALRLLRHPDIAAGKLVNPTHIAGSIFLLTARGASDSLSAWEMAMRAPLII